VRHHTTSPHLKSCAATAASRCSRLGGTYVVEHGSGGRHHKTGIAMLCLALADCRSETLSEPN
jgi:hypothetical protein